MSTFDSLPTKGVYTLIIFISKRVCLKVGNLGFQQFPMGYYTYTGSALGQGASSLRLRIARHLRKEKRKFWHIDFLLTHKNVTVTTVITAMTTGKSECEVNHKIERGETGFTPKTPVPRFGSSDCRQKCRSHLIYVGEADVKSQITTLYERLFGSYSNVLDICRNV